MAPVSFHTLVQVEPVNRLCAELDITEVMMLVTLMMIEEV